MLTISKGKAKAKEKASSAEKVQPKNGAITGYEAEVDRLAKIELTLAPFKDLIKEASDIAKRLRSVADDQAPADKQAVLSGSNGVSFVVSEKKMERTVTDIKDVRKLMGDKTFMQCAKINLTEIDKYLSEAEKAKVIVEGRTGSRTGKIVITP